MEAQRGEGTPCYQTSPGLTELSPSDSLSCEDDFPRQCRWRPARAHRGSCVQPAAQILGFTHRWHQACDCWNKGTQHQRAQWAAPAEHGCPGILLAYGLIFAWGHSLRPTPHFPLPREKYTLDQQFSDISVLGPLYTEKIPENPKEVLCVRVIALDIYQLRN